MELKVMTFNIHHGKGMDGKVNLERIAFVIEQSGADYISLNEVDRCFSKRSHFEDQIAVIAKKLNMYYAYGPALTFTVNGSGQLRQYGNGFLSRFPIESQYNHLFNARGVEGRSLLEVESRFYGQPLKLFITHLSLNPFVRHKQIEYILYKVKQQHKPVIMMGDWNMKPGSKAWHKITSYFKDVCHTVLNREVCTYPSRKPKTQLDYIFVNEHIQICSVEVVEKIPEASDHLPLQATLRLNPHLF
jgi:endonuclease/exonuclease/phosphatase family metal-dependent hydrolase